MDNARFRLLVVGDERGLCAGVQEALQREGYTVDAATDARTALELAHGRVYHVAVTDVRMPDMTGLQLLQRLKQEHADTQVILMTASGTVENAVEAMKAGAYDYLTKPLDMQRLRLLVAKALQFQNVVAENNELRQRLRKKAEPSLLVGEREGPPGLACEIRAGMSMAECEKLLIRQTLTHGTANREQAARLLGISRRTLQYKLKEYGLLAPKAAEENAAADVPAAVATGGRS